MGQVDDLLQQHSKLANERANFDALRQDVAELVLPDHANFTTKTINQGERRDQRQYDTTAQIESARHASAIDSLANPHSTKWHGLKSTDEKLNERDDVRQYFDDVGEVLFGQRYSPRAHFAAQVWDVYRGGGVFGDGALMIRDFIGGGLRYRSLPCHENYFTVDSDGQVSKFHRKYKLTAVAARSEFGESKLPDSIAKAAEKEPLRQFEFLHCIEANPERKTEYADARGMPFTSYELAIEDKKMLREGGYESWPVPVYRYDVHPGEWYGRGWACEVLSTIKVLNRAVKVFIQQGEKSINPSLLMADDGMLSYGSTENGLTPDLTAGGLTRGGLDSQGRELVKALLSGADLAFGEKFIEQLQQVIKNAALTSLFQILLNNPHTKTATEWLGLQQEKGQLVAPMVGRSVGGFHGQIIEREIDILNRQGKLPEMPRALIQAQGEYRIEYESPLARLMKVEEVASTQRWLTGLVPYAEARPDILDNVDLDEMARDSGNKLGVPQKIIMDVDKRDALRKDRAKQAAIAQTVQAAPQIAGALKDAASAQQIARDA